MSRRIVRLFVYDPDERVSDDEALIWNTEEPFVTSVSESDLWIEFGGDLMEYLGHHNDKRGETLDQEESRIRGHDVFLPPITLADVVKKVVVIA